MDKPTNHWSYFDKIYCISVDERTDRREEAKAQFHKVGLSEYVEFHIVKKHPNDSEEGIYDSHIACIKKGLLAGAGNIVIFEDDILFDGFSQQSLAQCIEFIRSTSDWRAFFFGCLVSRSRATQSKGVLKIGYRAQTHAYILNRGFAELLVQRSWNKIAYDGVLKTYKNGYYTVFPSFAFQSNSPTGNLKTLQLDKFRRLCGGFQRIQKRNEFYHRHRPIIIALHILVVLAIVLWFLHK